jgi:hypothetical protein
VKKMAGSSPESNVKTRPLSRVPSASIGKNIQWWYQFYFATERGLAGYGFSDRGLWHAQQFSAVC